MITEGAGVPVQRWLIALFLAKKLQNKLTGIFFLL